MWPFDIFSKKTKYINPVEIVYKTRYKDEAGNYRTVTVPAGRGSDGDTGAPDLYPKAFFVHDEICVTGKFDDGTPITNFQASTIYYDILGEKNKPGISKPKEIYIRATRPFRWLGTFILGGENLDKF